VSVPGLPELRDDELAQLEASVGAALATGTTEGLTRLGHGEITLVLGWPVDRPAVACKRLPVFPDAAGAAAWGRLIGEYVERLGERGVQAVPWQWRTTPAAGGGVSGWVLQPVLDRAALATNLLADDPSSAPTVFGRILDRVVGAVDERVGLDAQLSNWAIVDDELVYFDVTTPMLNDAAGRPRMDLRLLTAPLPAALRPVVRRFVAPGIVASYHRPRDVAVDLVGNLLKERLEHLVPGRSRRQTTSRPPLTVDEVEVLPLGHLGGCFQARRADSGGSVDADLPALLPGDRALAAQEV
jgi:hypothetical protein